MQREQPNFYKWLKLGGYMIDGANFDENLLKAGYALTDVDGKRYKQFKKVQLAEGEE